MLGIFVHSLNSEKHQISITENHIKDTCILKQIKGKIFQYQYVVFKNDKGTYQQDVPKYIVENYNVGDNIPCYYSRSKDDAIIWLINSITTKTISYAVMFCILFVVGLILIIYTVTSHQYSEYESF